MKNKRIWVINQFAGSPESGWGERHYYFAQYWKDLGYDVSIISGSFNHMFSNNIELDELYKHQIYNGVDFYWVRTPTYDPRSLRRFWSMFLFMIRILRLPAEELGRPDSIIVSSMPIFPIWSGLIFKKKYGAQLIFEIRDIWPLTLQMLGAKSKFHPAVLFIGWFEKIGYRKSDWVVSLLPNAKAHVEKVAGKEVKFGYIPNGVSMDYLDRTKLDKDISDKIPRDKFVVGYTGTLSLANAMDYFIRAANELKNRSDIFFVIVGDGYLKDELMELAYGNENVLFLPRIPKSSIQDLLALVDVCYVGRNNSTLFSHGVSANKYFDYMLAGKPILDSNNLVKDPVELAKCGFVIKPESVESIVEGVIKFSGMSAEDRSVMGLKGKRYVLEHHSIKNLAERYTKFL